MSPLAGKTVLVTGSNSFIAGRLAERLSIEEGATVRVLIRNWTNAAWISRLNVNFTFGDLLFPETLKDAITGCDIVFHCASGGDTYSEYMATNVTGTKNLLVECQRQNVNRLVYLSSVTVHGCHFPEKLEPSSPFVRTRRGYSDSKIAAEELLSEFGKETGFPIVVIRPTFVWGPRANQFTIGFLNSIQEGKLRLIDGGEHVCNAVYVDNLVDLILRCGWHSNAPRNTFFSTDGGGYTWSQLLNGYAQILKKPSLSSISSVNLSTRIASRAIEWTDSVMDRMKGNPAPLWQKIVRRLSRNTNIWIRKRGFPDPWYLGLMSSRSVISLDNSKILLSYQPRIPFSQALSQTRSWVVDQLGVQLLLTDAFGTPLPE